MMIIILLIKIVDMLRIEMKQNINVLLKIIKENGIEHQKDPEIFFIYSNDMQDVYKSIEKYSPERKQKVVIVFDDTIANMIRNRKLNQKVAEPFITGIKLNISTVFITQCYFAVRKGIRLNRIHFLS